MSHSPDLVILLRVRVMFVFCFLISHSIPFNIIDLPRLIYMNN